MQRRYGLIILVIVSSPITATNGGYNLPCFQDHWIGYMTAAGQLVNIYNISGKREKRELEIEFLNTQIHFQEAWEKVTEIFKDVLMVVVIV